MIHPRCLTAPVGAAARAAARHRAVLPRLATDRLDLRPATLADFPLWAGIFAEPDSTPIGGPADTEAAWESFCVYAAGWLLHGHGLWAVDRRADGALVGFVLLGLEWADAEPEIGWLFGAASRGQGYATEAAAAVRDHALALLGPGGAVSCVAPGHAASEAVARRLGARRDPAAEAAFTSPQPERPRTAAMASNAVAAVRSVRFCGMDPP